MSDPSTFCRSPLTMFASDGGAPAPRRPPAHPTTLFASDGGAPAPRRPPAHPTTLFASDGGAPAPRRPPAHSPRTRLGRFLAVLGHELHIQGQALQLLYEHVEG